MSQSKTKEELSKINFTGYILKNLFLHKISISEIRLCIFLTSNKGKTINDLSYSERLWVSGGKQCKSSRKSLKDFESTLIKFNLLNNDGIGKQLKDEEYCIADNIGKIYYCKNQREFFIECMNLWYKGGKFISVKKDYIYAIFGKEVRVRNQNIKRTLSSMKLNSYFEERKNDFLYHKSPTLKQYNHPFIPYKEYLKTNHWKEIAKAYKEKYGKCQLCGSTKHLNVHHNNYDCLWRETDNDLIVLCQDCHAKFHNKSER